jgi:hypothetical protein
VHRRSSNTASRLGALLLMLAIAPLRAQTPGTPRVLDISFEEYVTLVDRLADDVERAAPENLAAIVATAPRRLRVNTGDQVFDVSLGSVLWMPGDARRDPKSGAQRGLAIRDYLRAIRFEAGALKNGSGPRVTRAMADRLDAILAQGEFTRSQPSSRLTRLRERLTDWLRALWESLGGRASDRDGAARLLVWLSAAGGVIALALWAHRRIRRRGNGPVGEQHGGSPDSGAAVWALRAATAAGQGRASEAVRFAYRAAVARLADLGVWQVDDSRTAREYVSLLKSDELSARAFRQIARELERIVYARREATQDDLGRIVADLETLGCLRRHEQPI